MIRIVGDICFADGFFDMGFGIGSKLHGKYDPFENLDFKKEDVWIGNLECVIANISDKAGYESLPFRTPCEIVASLHHLDIYGVANNHIMQHGEKAFHEMIGNINKLGSRHVGSLSCKSTRFNYKDKAFGLMAFSRRSEVFSDSPLYWVNPECREIELELGNIKACNFKIAYLHWGNEFMDYPNVEQKTFARWLIDIGFDMVVGMHPHVMQGFEIYKGKYIFYSLGNFLFNMPAEDTRYSAIVNIDIANGELQVSYSYAHVNKNNQVVLIGAESMPKRLSFSSLNEKLCFNGDNEIYYKDMFKRLSAYRHINHRWMLKTIHRHGLNEIIFTLKDFLLRRLKRKR